MLAEIWYNYSNGTREQAAAYTYTSSGQLYRVDDFLSGKSTVFGYNNAGKLVYSGESDTDDLKYDIGTRYYYNKDGYLSSEYTRMDYLVGSTAAIFYYNNSYIYDDSGKIKTGSSKVDNATTSYTYTYDAFDRLTAGVYNHSGTSVTNSYTYNNWTGRRGTYRVGDHTFSIGTTLNTTNSYSYFADNIVKITVNGTEIRYVYDDMNQLVREDNGLLNKTIVYTYDNAGNILSKVTYALTAESVTPTSPTSTVNYSYANSEWGDLLTTYNGSAITYDAIGNPLTRGSYTYTWEGRRLVGLTYGSTTTVSYEYNADGLRTSKTVNGTEYNYYYSGDRLISETFGNAMIVYIYDAFGTPMGMKYRTTAYAEDVWDSYIFETNALGDVVTIYNLSGTKLVSYSYDAYGVVTKLSFNGGSSTGAWKNSLTYRGYYYDTESSMYYLQSRYYDPAMGRFISADSYVSTGQGLLGYNMYSYCNNNPVNFCDPSGDLPLWLGVALIATAAAATYVLVANIVAVVSSNDAVEDKNYTNMDDETFYRIYYDEDAPTYGMTEDEQKSYISKYREKNINDVTSNWTEAQMLREMKYHDSAYELVTFLGSDPMEKGTWAYRLKHVSFESKQDFTTYARRIIGNSIPW